MIYQTDDLVVLRGNESLPSGKLRMEFVGPPPTAEDIALLARAHDEHLLAAGSKVSRPLLDRLMMRVFCPDAGVP